MGQNSKAVAKRREELQAEKLDKKIAYYVRTDFDA